MTDEIGARLKALDIIIRKPYEFCILYCDFNMDFEEYRETSKNADILEIMLISYEEYQVLDSVFRPKEEKIDAA